MAEHILDTFDELSRETIKIMRKKEDFTYGRGFPEGKGTLKNEVYRRI
ncbi:MAG: hypothetical protein Q8P40_13055 [Nitrospirota bacterium]|nr:hypothetical protein [Nitrospirota bacterium]